MNPRNDPVFIPKGMVLADFTVLDSSYDILKFPMYNTVRNVSQCETDCQKFDGFDAFCANFDFLVHMYLQANKLRILRNVYMHTRMYLWRKRKYRRPYRLPTDKREVLRTQLDELLSQGVISPVSETDSLPITSPILLVAKRKSNGSHVAQGKEAHLTSYRFCCDFRYLNSQTLDFSYNIPDVQELTESFSQTISNFISTIDMSSGFFQIGISKE